jgi:hypothetical protein
MLGAMVDEVCWAQLMHAPESLHLGRIYYCSFLSAHADEAMDGISKPLRQTERMY